ncbi:DUF6259 domain-containing protein [Cohnella abietis]|uniref:DUF6259 domain-containing protein n=1 Tax=Cohnella abietis TaxID=2507935 RepID=A0A3T1D0J6_9BACL|nr:DUF6259 domain-containing protein [Cohnella abietis]BBI31588.1 hypothetical protein KCTCHS21_09870 [Cohnella abietis]
MRIIGKKYELHLNENTGSILSLISNNREFIKNGDKGRPLFTIRFRDREGKAIDLTALDAKQSYSGKLSEEINFYYKQLGIYEIDVEVKVNCPYNDALIYWNLSVVNQSDLIIEWIDFPDIVVPNDLTATGGSSKIVWPAMEGALIEDVTIREQGWLKYKETGYPSRGWEGIYPGPCPTQFMAYYNEQGGLYIGAHDEQANVKSIEFREYDDGVRLQFRLFAEGFGRGTYRMNYPMVLGVFQGDWCDAASLYRDWYQSSTARKAPKLEHNPDIPQWLLDSPVIVTYPVRGTKDVGNMDPNEYFPYSNAIPDLKRLSKAFDSKVMALLMHWEGTAPWAPPYVWPPFGGEEIFKHFVDQMHEEGHLVGLYGSGIAWTNESLLVPEYNKQAQLEAENLKEIMCAPPEGEIPFSLICGGGQRWGYDMCPTNDFVTKTVSNEVKHILDSGCDYIQYFDQNLGGLSYLCFNEKHGHPPGPGKWQKEAMIHLYQHLRELVEESGRKVLIGCEAAAAEPFIPDLLFNDMRFNINLWVGTPIPLYQFVYHEYVNNFMGNQNTVGSSIDLNRSPNNILWRTAYSFNAGDMMTVVLREHGNIHWDWGTEWTESLPDQDHIMNLIHNLNGWRTGFAKPYLVFGRMEKPLALLCEQIETIYMQDGHQLNNPSLLTSLWRSSGDQLAQLIVNYTPNRQSGVIFSEERAGTTTDIITSVDGSQMIQKRFSEQGQLSVEVEPLSAIMLML